MTAAVLLAAGVATRPAAALPDVLVVSIDTLRADHLGSYGYGRQTSPRMDELLAQGARFTSARTVEPLTAPALTSMITGLHPHDHAATRNGLRMRDDLLSCPDIFKRRGYDTAALVGSWTLRDRLSGLAEHYEEYQEVLTKARWLGFLKGEATAEDLTDAALEWLDDRSESPRRPPYFLWVHYVEPHAPYVLQKEFEAQVGEGASSDRRHRYDTEIAFVDHHVGRLLDGIQQRFRGRDLITVLVADHGESLGEHDYWGHGRHLYDVSLRIPLGIVWPGRISPSTVDAPAMITDLASTLLGLAGLPVPDFYAGVDWGPHLLQGVPATAGRVTLHQAHRGAVQRRDAPQRVRQQGLLEVARIAGERKEVARVTNDRRWLFDLSADPGENRSTAAFDSEVSQELLDWLARVREGLVRSDDLPPPALDDADLEALRDLGYID
jgi:arylsulfatase A-like enzyme